MNDVHQSSDRQAGSDVGNSWHERMRSRGRKFNIAYRLPMWKALGRAFERAGGYPDEAELKRLAHSSDREKLTLLRELGSDERVVLKFSPASGTESILYPAPRDDFDSAAPWRDVFAPPGFQPLHLSLNAFVAQRFVAEIKRYLHAYVELYTFGASALERSIVGMVDSWELDEGSYIRWSDHIDQQYLSPNWAKEEWVAHNLSEDLLNGLERRAALCRALDDRHAPAEPVALEACARLLLDGVEGYWAKNKAELAGTFRQAFLTGAKVAYAVSDDGKLSEVLRDWWQGGECTRLLHARNFVNACGALLEKLGIAGEPPGSAPSVEERVAFVASKLEARTEGHDVAERIQRVYRFLLVMVDDGRIPRESHTEKALKAKLYEAFPDHGAADRNVEQAIALLMLAYPELKAGRGRQPKK